MDSAWNGKVSDWIRDSSLRISNKSNCIIQWHKNSLYSHYVNFLNRLLTSPIQFCILRHKVTTLFGMRFCVFVLWLMHTSCCSSHPGHKKRLTSCPKTCFKSSFTVIHCSVVLHNIKASLNHEEKTQDVNKIHPHHQLTTIGKNHHSYFIFTW